MRKIILAFVFYPLELGLIAQDRIPPVTLSYYSPFGTHLGTKVGTTFLISNSEVEGNLKPNTLFFNPQLGYFVRPTVNRNLQINSEIGIKRGSRKGKAYIALIIGLGYLLSSEVVGGSVNLGSAEFIKDRSKRSSLLPVINLELGSNKQKRLTFFYRLFYGRKVSLASENSGFFGLEIGTRFLTKRSANPS